MDSLAAMRLHDAAFRAVLVRYGLTGLDGAEIRHVQQVYADEYPLVKDLPLADGLEHIGKIAAQELGRWRASPPRTT